MLKELNIKIPTIAKKLDLANYSSAFKGNSVRVWVNPPRSLLDEYVDVQAEFRKMTELIKPSTSKLLNKFLFSERRRRRLEAKTKELNRRFYVWFSKILSAHPNENTHITADDLEVFHKEVNDKDPAFWSWLTKSAESMIIAHQENLPKV
jgi:hypothetical protein